ncbi:hypothetical protein LSAT2_030635, partial [Lamellibrachia satsuma]
VLCSVVPLVGPNQADYRLKRAVLGCFPLDFLDCHGNRYGGRSYRVHIVLCHVLLTAAQDPLSCWMPGHIVGWVVCTGLILDDHPVWLETKSPALDPKWWSRLLPNGLQWLVVADDCELRRSIDELVEVFTGPD